MHERTRSDSISHDDRLGTRRLAALEVLDDGVPFGRRRVLVEVEALPAGEGLDGPLEVLHSLLVLGEEDDARHGLLGDQLRELIAEVVHLRHAIEAIEHGHEGRLRAAGRRLLEPRQSLLNELAALELLGEAPAVCRLERPKDVRGGVRVLGLVEL